MQKITNATDLKMAILQLEDKQAAEWPLLKNQFHATYEGFKLINILKSTFKEGVSSPDLVTNTLKAAVGLATGFVTKKLLVGKTINPFKKILGIIVEMVVAKNVAENADSIKSIGSIFFKKFGNKKIEQEKAK